MLLRWQNACLRGELRSRHGSTHGAGRHTHLRIVADPFGLPHVAARHHVEFVAILSKPHGSSDSSTGLAKGGQGNMLLALDGRRNRVWHKLHLSWRRDGLALQRLASSFRQLGLATASNVRRRTRRDFIPTALHPSPLYFIAP